MRNTLAGGAKETSAARRGGGCVSRPTSLTLIEGCLAEVTKADETAGGNDGSHGLPWTVISFPWARVRTRRKNLLFTRAGAGPSKLNVSWGRIGGNMAASRPWFIARTLEPDEFLREFLPAILPSDSPGNMIF